MSAPLKKKIRDLDALLSGFKAVAIDYPDDRALRLTIAQHSERREVLNAELKKAMNANSIHVFDMALQTAEDVSIAALSRLFYAMDNLIKGIGRSIDVKCLPELRLAALFNGSFGIRTATKYDETLVRGDYALCFTKFFELNRAITEGQDVSEIFKEDRITLRKFVRYYSDVIQSNYPIRMNWTSPALTNTVDEFFLTIDDAVKAKSRLLIADVADTEELTITGQMKELNLIHHSFIVVEAVKTKSGQKQTHVSYSEGDSQVIDKLNKSITVLVRHERSYNHEREVNEEKIELIRFLE